MRSPYAYLGATESEPAWLSPRKGEEIAVAGRIKIWHLVAVGGFGVFAGMMWALWPPSFEEETEKMAKAGYAEHLRELLRKKEGVPAVDHVQALEKAKIAAARIKERLSQIKRAG